MEKVRFHGAPNLGSKNRTEQREREDELDPGLFLLAQNGVSVEHGHDDVALDVGEEVQVDELAVIRVLLRLLLALR